jgi:hypothetical protein
VHPRLRTRPAPGRLGGLSERIGEVIEHDAEEEPG